MGEGDSLLHCGRGKTCQAGQNRVVRCRTWVSGTAPLRAWLVRPGAPSQGQGRVVGRHAYGAWNEAEVSGSVWASYIAKTGLRTLSPSAKESLCAVEKCEKEKSQEPDGENTGGHIDVRSFHPAIHNEKSETEVGEEGLCEKEDRQGRA